MKRHARPEATQCRLELKAMPHRTELQAMPRHRERQAATGSSASSRLMSRTAARPARLAPIVLADGP
ncbi:hypothetical protein DWG14_07421 [Streptomyces griseorubiginosus]|uniref:Uncharacterized protein n=1 Tax=Streptomyces griseorubiginosus TaxID=67304 RepID=A0AAI8PSC8_9ACTN|nr:hypothetical protein DWG14_07421 [Streptomyces griseorubiginosus]